MNTKHAAALEAAAAEVLDLRAAISVQLAALVRVASQLDDLADTRQSIGPGMVTEDAIAARARQTAADRAAARGLNQPTRATGLKLLNTTAGFFGTGQVTAPVSIAAVSAAAEIRYALLHHLARLAHPATLAALEAEQTDAEDHGLCRLPRRRILTLPPASDNETVATLAVRLAAAVDAYTSRKGLTAILRDLEHLEAAGRDVVDGPARTNHPDPCPWCGRHSLVIHHRKAGRDVQVISCDGHHRCECDYDQCDCHRQPHRNRHAWENSARATNTWTQLRNLQNARKDLMAYETRAADAVARALELHTPVDLLQLSDDCPNDAEHGPEHGHTPDGTPVCYACPPASTVCDHCRDDDGSYLPWPCPTAHALDLDQPTTD